jgi:hypothetical protein
MLVERLCADAKARIAVFRVEMLNATLCADIYCQICFRALHLKGKRALHTTTPFGGAPRAAKDDDKTATTNGMALDDASQDSLVREVERDMFTGPSPVPVSGNKPALQFAERAKVSADALNCLRCGERVFAQYTPLRLAQHERQFLRLLESSVFVSDYVDKVSCERCAAFSFDVAFRVHARLIQCDSPRDRSARLLNCVKSARYSVVFCSRRITR